jgi:hypothetical protein
MFFDLDFSQMFHWWMLFVPGWLVMAYVVAFEVVNMFGVCDRAMMEYPQWQKILIFACCCCERGQNDPKLWPCYRFTGRDKHVYNCVRLAMYFHIFAPMGIVYFSR